ncbi:signal peptidase I [Pontibacter ummariensis]|uniref:Signal peptidase I n=1 Tax=Pontibacter ummariensis TaxID=1610492 RepID=A0A239C649_9BACT|nr:signal peptidase I [Pontibacter ummariensis]PRY15460.1 signal peptidase I [Pontibacter ummariensis]SNS14863.1 signal peptidase I [Pontibacter ummariensis]
MKLPFRKKAPSRKRQVQTGVLRQWGDALMFAVVAACFIRWATFEAYAIPTPSMEKSMLVGDHLFVSKLHYGPRTPMTPLQVPLTHQTFWGMPFASYSDALQVPSFRFPGFSEVRRNDVVVFNYPAEEEHPTDLKTHYVKRCVGIAGDSIAIRDMQVFINGKAADNPEERQYRYFLKTDKVLNKEFFTDRNITEAYPGADGYLLHTTPAKAKALASLEIIQEVQLLKAKPGEAEPAVFPQAPALYTWNQDNFGPVYIPQEGATVAITPHTLPLYEKVILDYEQNKNAVVRGGKLWIDGKEVKQYTFKQNYYFMMGDNRHNSLDSRYWGFVPEDHIVGKAAFVWFSVDPTEELPDKIRWGRLFSLIE